jgi:hypothetical protein
MSCLALGLAGCQGGGANPPSLNTGVAPPPSVTQSGAVTPAGGSVTTTLGTQTVVITAPAGALSGPGTLSVTVFSNTAAPKTLHSAGRKVQTIGADSVLVVEFTVTLTGATLLKPLQASLTTGAAATGSIFRLAGLGSSFDDVDTVTFGAGKATTDQNILYSRMSLASGTFYAFYVEPSSEATAAATAIVTVTGSAANPVAMFGASQFSGAEAQPNGFPYLDPAFSYVLDNATIGSVSPTTGLFTAGPVDGAGNITVTDTTAGRGNPNGKVAVTVSSQRPGNIGDAFTFTGTLSSTTQQTNSNITSQPQTDSATVALTSTVTTATPIATPVPGIQVLTNSVETDTYPLLTVKTTSTNGFGYVIGPPPANPPATYLAGTVLNLGSDAKDSNGVEYVTQFSTPNGNGIIDVLPEKAGAFGPNTAALTYTETDQANFSRNRTVAADGSYVEQGKDAFGDVQTINSHSDLSAFYDANQYSGYNFTITKPTGNPLKITVSIKQGNTNRGSLTIPSWIPATMTQPSTETDVDNGTTTYPAACKAPAKYGTSGNQLVQTINRADPALGNLETLTTTTYLSGTVGPVCIQMVDSVKTFYDYTLQNGFVLFVSGNGQPIQLTTVSETLTLQSATTSGGTVTNALTRGTSAVRGTSSIASSAFAPLAFARARFEHAVREKLGGMRTATFNRNFMSQGVQTL